MGTPNKKVAGAFIVGFLLVLGAYVLRINAPTMAQPGTAGVAVVEAPGVFERSTISERDANRDGTPDWKEALSTVDVPPLYNTAEATSTDFDTLTSQIGINIFKDIVQRRATMGSEGSVNQESIVSENAREVMADIKTEILTKDDITVLPEETVTMDRIQAYYNEMAIILSREGKTEDSLTLLQRAVQENDRQAVAELQTLSKSYNEVIASLKEVAVPEMVVPVHLDLLNAMLFIKDNVAVFAEPMRDPMRTLLHLRRMQSDVTGFQQALKNYVLFPETAFDLSQVNVAPDEPLLLFYGLYLDITEEGTVPGSR